MLIAIRQIKITSYQFLEYEVIKIYEKNYKVI